MWELVADLMVRHEVVVSGTGRRLVWLRSDEDAWDPVQRAAARAWASVVPVGFVGVLAHAVGGRAFMGGQWLDPVVVDELVRDELELVGDYFLPICEGLEGEAGSFAHEMGRLSEGPVWASRWSLVVDVVLGRPRGRAGVSRVGQLVPGASRWPFEWLPGPGGEGGVVAVPPGPHYPDDPDDQDTTGGGVYVEAGAAGSRPVEEPEPEPDIAQPPLDFGGDTSFGQRPQAVLGDIVPDRHKDEGLPELPPNTVALFADGSYAVTKQPFGSINEFTGFNIYGPDRKPRGNFDAEREEDDDFVGIPWLANKSDVPGAVDLNTWYVTQHTTKEYFQFLLVANPRLGRLLQLEYGMDRLASSTPGGVADFRQLARVAKRIAGERLERSGTTLAPGDGSTGPVAFHHPWTTYQADWAPVTPDGTPLDIVTEKLEDGSTRRVSGRYVNPTTFEIVNPRTGVAIYKLHAPRNDSDARTWTVGILSSPDSTYFSQQATRTNWTSATGVGGRMRHWVERKLNQRTRVDKAHEFVQFVLSNGERLRDDFTLVGYGLYQLNINGTNVMVRARLDDAGNVVRAKRPTPLDERLDQLGLNTGLTRLLQGGWTIHSSHDNDFDVTSRRLRLDAFNVADAHFTLGEAYKAYFGTEIVNDPWQPPDNAEGTRQVSGSTVAFPAAPDVPWTVEENLDGSGAQVTAHRSRSIAQPRQNARQRAMASFDAVIGAWAKQNPSAGAKATPGLPARARSTFVEYTLAQFDQVWQGGNPSAAQTWASLQYRLVAGLDAAMRNWDGDPSTLVGLVGSIDPTLDVTAGVPVAAGRYFRSPMDGAGQWDAALAWPDTQGVYLVFSVGDPGRREIRQDGGNDLPWEAFADRLRGLAGIAGTEVVLMTCGADLAPEDGSSALTKVVRDKLQQPVWGTTGVIEQSPGGVLLRPYVTADGRLLPGVTPSPGMSQPGPIWTRYPAGIGSTGERVGPDINAALTRRGGRPVHSLAMVSVVHWAKPTGPIRTRSERSRRHHSVEWR